MRSLSALFLFCSLGYAEVIFPGSGLIAHIADGGGIQTEITLTNLDDTPSACSVSFYDDNGNPLSLVTNVGTRSVVDETLAPHASSSVRTTGTANTATQGWAFIQSQGTVGGSATFRFSVGQWSGSEAVVPVDTWRNNHFSLAFDHTDSAVMGLAMVNPLLVPIAIILTFRDENGGVIVTDTFNVDAHAHRAMVTTFSYPATVGKRGTIEISTTGSYMSMVALRFGPSAISSVVPLVSNKWAAFDSKWTY